MLNEPAVVRLRPGLDYEPDIFFVAREQLERLEERYFSGAPTLVIEVISPGTRTHDLGRKATNYRNYGVPEYWAVDPELQTLYQHVLPAHQSDPYLVTPHTEGNVQCRSIPGFGVDVGWLWQDPLPSELDCVEWILP